MDTLESKVSDGSEVTATNEEDMCALFLNQLFNHSEFTTEMENQSHHGNQSSAQPFSALPHLMEHLLPLHGDNEALLSYQRTYSEVRCVTDRPLQDNQTETQPVRTDVLRSSDAGDPFLVPETPADCQLKLMQSMQPSQTSVRPPQTLRSLQHEELEESRQWFQPALNSGRSQNLPSIRSSIHQSDPQEELNRIPQFNEDSQPPSTPINVKPVTLFTQINPFHAHHLNPSFNPFHTPHLNPSFYPFHTPHLNPSWPVVVPHFNPVALAPHQNPFCPIYSPPLQFNHSAVSCLVLQPHMKVYPVYPTPYLHSNTQSPSQASFSGNSSARWFPEDVQDTYGLWQRLCETAKGFSSSSPETEALACFFMRMFRSLAVHSPDLPFTAAVNAAVQEWRKTSNSEREQYYINARMFIEWEGRDKNTNRADQAIPAGNVKKTRKRFKKVVQERPVQDLAERTLTEYSRVMDTLESKVSDGSEVTATNEEDACALFLNQLFNHSEFTTEAGLDVDFISSLLYADRLKENSLDMLSDIVPEPVAGCSDWTHATVSEAQGNVTENNGQNAFETLTEAQSSDQSISVQETIHSDLQELDGNTSGQKHKISYDAQLDSTVQSNFFSLQNYKSHHAMFTYSIKHPTTSADGGTEHDGEENIGQKTVKSTNKRNMDSDVPNDSQITRKTDANIKEISEENRDKKEKTRRGRRNQRKITMLDERTTDDKDGRRPKRDQRHRKIQDGQRRSTPTKREAIVQETDSIKIIIERKQRTRSSAMDGRRGNLRQHDGQMRESREENLDRYTRHGPKLK